jgi:hypothetical protein
MYSVAARIAAPLAVLLIVIAFLWEHRTFVDVQSDDAYISYRYAQNLADGYGLVFNRGERVEGYTNLSWVLLVALGITAGVEGELFGFVLSLVASSALLVATYIYACVLLRGARGGLVWLAPLAPLLLFLSNPFAMWSSSGMETPLFALCCVNGFIAAHRERRKWVFFWCIAALLTRPDGVLLAAVLIGLPLLQRIVAQGVAALRWESLREALLYATAILAITIWRLVYYGDVVPNTFHAKVGGLHPLMGVLYSWQFLLDSAVFLLPPFLYAASQQKSLRLELCFLLLLFAYCGYVGGDVFPFSRFFLPVIPLLAGGALLGVALLLRAPKPWFAIAAGLVLTSAAWSLYGPPLSYSGLPEFEKVTFPVSAKRTIVLNNHSIDSTGSEFLRTSLPEHELVAALGIGKLGYRLPNPILDLLGLTDKVIAKSTQVEGDAALLPGHQRTDTAYVLSRAPAVVLIPPPNAHPWIVLPAVRGLWESEEFAQRYSYDERVGGYVRNDITLEDAGPRD